MILSAFLPAVTDENIKKIDFYHDFIIYLNRLKQKPIKRTTTGNISLSDIKDILHSLKTTPETIEEHRQFNWALRTEDQLQTLTQIKIIASVLRLTQNRKGHIHLTKNGTSFLSTLSPLQQYEQLALTYWQKVNWDYFSYGFKVGQDSLCMALQDIQENIWHTLFRKGTVWIDYLKFCQALSEYFHLHQFLDKYLDSNPYSKYFGIELDLIRKNLLLFGCVEVKFDQNKNIWDRHITCFKPTPLGLHMFNQAIPSQPPDFTA